MDTTRRRPARVAYQARPGRRAVVAPSLAELRGPVGGVVELPNRLFWQPDRRVDLGSPGVLIWMYETVLREASTVEQLRAWLHGPTLVRLWPELFVPAGVRQAWQERHAVLRVRHVAA